MNCCSRGTYCLELFCSRKTVIGVGKLGEMEFRKGCYFYVGSALNSMERRLSRHTRKGKKIFWHIDYLTANNNFHIENVYIIESMERLECKKAMELGQVLEVVPRFGSSDCRCPGHLFYTGERKKPINVKKTVIIKSGFSDYKPCTKTA